MRVSAKIFSALLFSGIAVTAFTQTAHAVVQQIKVEPTRAGGEVHYQIDVPAGVKRLTIAMRGGTGEADLYVKYGDQSTPRDYDCRPWKTGNRETCKIDNPQAGSYFYSVRAHKDISGVTVSVDHDGVVRSEPASRDVSGSSGNPILLEKGVRLDDLSGEHNSLTYFMLPVMGDARNLQVTINGAVNESDADLYVRYNKAPTFKRFNCRANKIGSDEKCRIRDVLAGRYYIMISAHEPYEGLTLIADYDDGALPVALTPDSDPSPDPIVSEPEPVSTACIINEVDQRLLDAHNVARSQLRYCGSVRSPAAPPLEWSCTLAQAAENHSSDMATHNFFDHTGSDGSKASQRISNLGYDWMQWGENIAIAGGRRTVDRVMQAWLNSPRHCRNIMSPKSTELGVAVVKGNRGRYSHYWTAVFGKPQ